MSCGRTWSAASLAWHRCRAPGFAHSCCPNRLPSATTKTPASALHVSSITHLYLRLRVGPLRCGVRASTARGAGRRADGGGPTSGRGDCPWAPSSMPRWAGLASNGTQAEVHLHCIDARESEQVVLHDPPGPFLSPHEFSRFAVQVSGKDAHWARGLIATVGRGCSRFVRPSGWSDRVFAGGEWC